MTDWREQIHIDWQNFCRTNNVPVPHWEYGEHIIAEDIENFRRNENAYGTGKTRRPPGSDCFEDSRYFEEVAIRAKELHRRDQEDGLWGR